MNGKMLTVGFIVLTAMAIASKAEEPAPVEKVPASEEVSLSKDLMPLFARSCAGCHQRENGNPDAVKNDLYFEKKEDVLKGIGSLIVPGNPHDSYLHQVLIVDENKPKWIKTMPPPRSKAPKPSDEEIKQIADWIKAGAKDN